MDRARAADDLPAERPLYGVPFVIKDIIDTADMPAGWGFPPYKVRQPESNAPCVDALIAAGAPDRLRPWQPSSPISNQARPPTGQFNPYAPAVPPAGSAAAVGIK